MLEPGAYSKEADSLEVVSSRTRSLSLIIQDFKAKYDPADLFIY